MTTAAMSRGDLELLHRLHEAGVIKLDAFRIEADPRHIEWTYEELRRDLMAKQRLRSATDGRRYSTVESTGRYLRYLEGHGRDPVEVPVQLRPPDEASWLRHVEYRLGSGDNPGTLNPYRKSLVRLLKHLGLPVWECLKEPFPEDPAPWTLPPDDVVPQFWLREDLHDDRKVARTLAYMMHYGFHVGVRPPSELLTLRLQDVDFAGNTIVVTEWKKNRRRMLRDVEPFVMSAPNHKSLRNYLQHVRPLYAHRDETAFFVDPRDGRRWCPQELGEALSQAGKQIWEPFRPYTMRRWCATQRLIESGMDIYYVARWLGDRVSTVEKYYVDHAKAAQSRGSVLKGRR